MLALLAQAAHEPLGSDWKGIAALPYGAPQHGRTVSYDALLPAKRLPPRAGFTLRYQRFCGPVQVGLDDLATGSNLSHRWDFGDGTQSLLPSPPAHTYATAGVYYLTQIVSNSFGADTARATVVVAEKCPSYCAANGLGGSSSTAAYFTRVRLTTLDNQQVRGPGGGGYQDFTALPPAQLVLGRLDTLQTDSPQWHFNGNGPWAQVTAWIDFNQDGNFALNERIGDRLSFSPHLLSFRVPATARVGATRLRVVITRPPSANNVPTSSCPRPGQTGTTEDYTVLVLPPPMAPRAGFLVDRTPSCTGTVQFQDTSAYAPTAWRWDFGDGSQSTQQHPRHAYAAAGIYTVSLQATNRYGVHLLVRPAVVTVTQVSVGVRPAACRPPDRPLMSNWSPLIHTDQVVIGNWFYINPPRDTAYVDETCTVPPIPLSTIQAVNFRHHVVVNYPMHVKMWLDSNDDGTFDEVAELLYSSFGTSSTANPKLAALMVPAATVLHRPLRLRLWWMHGGGSPAVDGPSCYWDEFKTQIRDFAAVVTAGPLTARSSLPSGFNVFPIPARDILYLTGPAAAQLPVRLHDALGRKVYATTANIVAQRPYALHLPSLSAGIYWLTVADQSHPIKVAVE